MRIERKAYLDLLVSRMNNGRAKVITGLRRSGKSYLLFEIFAEHLMKTGVPAKNIVKVALDDDVSAHLRNPLKLGEHIRNKLKGRGRHYVLIDEIQMCEACDNPAVAGGKVDFYDVLNGLLRMDQVDVYVTGSNSKLLSSEIATSFRGRGDIIDVHPLSFAEYLPASGLEEFRALQKYMVYGGMPGAALEADDTGRARYLKGLFEEIYLKDLAEHHKLRDEAALNAVCDVLCSATGSLTNPNRLANSLKTNMKIDISNHTVGKYLDYMVDAFIFRRAQRYDVKGRRYLEYPSKYYCEDVGLRNARLNFRQTEYTHLMENIIYNELIGRGYSVDVGVVPVEQTQGGKRELVQKEIDFVVNSGAGKVYIQSAFAIENEEKRAQELSAFAQIKDTFPRLVVIGGMEPSHVGDDGIRYVNISDFLLDRYILSSLLGSP